MKKWIIAVLAVTLAGLFALPGIASAQQEGEVTVHGRGWLYARGTGEVDIDMAGRFRAHVNGDVIITDHAGDMRVRFRGQSDTADQERTSNVILDDFRGTINVVGSNFSVNIEGNVELHAHGKGRATLDGRGIYKTRRGHVKPWDGMVDLEDPQVQPAA